MGSLVIGYLNAFYIESRRIKATESARPSEEVTVDFALSSSEYDYSMVLSGPYSYSAKSYSLGIRQLFFTL